MKKITVPELKARGYLVCDVKDLGRCVVVPGAEFDPDWAVCLEDAGYRCVDDVLDGAPVTFVVLGGARSNEVMEVGKVELLKEQNKETIKPIVPETPKSNKRGHANWTESEDSFLVALWKQMPPLTVSEIGDAFIVKFPHRTWPAVAGRITCLQGKRLIAPKQKHKHKSEMTIEMKGKGAKASDSSAVSGEAVPSVIIVPDVLKPLAEAYESLSRAYVELKTDFKNLETLVVNNMATVGTVTDIEKELRRYLTEHKHAMGSGEAMLPMEAPP